MTVPTETLANRTVGISTEVSLKTVILMFWPAPSSDDGIESISEESNQRNASGSVNQLWENFHNTEPAESSKLGDPPGSTRTYGQHALHLFLLPWNSHGRHSEFAVAFEFVGVNPDSGDAIGISFEIREPFNYSHRKPIVSTLILPQPPRMTNCCFPTFRQRFIRSVSVFFKLCLIVWLRGGAEDDRNRHLLRNFWNKCYRKGALRANLEGISSWSTVKWGHPELLTCCNIIPTGSTCKEPLARCIAGLTRPDSSESPRLVPMTVWSGAWKAERKEHRVTSSCIAHSNTWRERKTMGGDREDEIEQIIQRRTTAKCQSANHDITRRRKLGFETGLVELARRHWTRKIWDGKAEYWIAKLADLGARFPASRKKQRTPLRHIYKQGTYHIRILLPVAAGAGEKWTHIDITSARHGTGVRTPECDPSELEGMKKIDKADARALAVARVIPSEIADNRRARMEFGFGEGGSSMFACGKAEIQEGISKEEKVGELGAGASERDGGRRRRSWGWGRSSPMQVADERRTGQDRRDMSTYGKQAEFLNANFFSARHVRVKAERIGAVVIASSVERRRVERKSWGAEKRMTDDREPEGAAVGDGGPGFRGKIPGR
ncbi:hypothetical protein R3P38DRAFT_3350391 [Favolaschia claudopus]|uniref:Uncharacterized protein n=1 Tax=Favolaschia claudopus TaxID=2862362 RepID=A0AAW0CHD5_9AGAR